MRHVNIFILAIFAVGCFGIWAAIIALVVMDKAIGDKALLVTPFCFIWIVCISEIVGRMKSR